MPMLCARPWQRTTCLLIAVALLAAGCRPAAPVRDVVPAAAADVYRARLYGRPAPLLSQRLPALDEEQAYRIQRGALEQLFGANVFGAQAPMGYRAALTSAGARARFGGVDAIAPIAGVLLPASEVAAGDDGFHVRLDRFRAPLVEVELGFRLGQRVSAPVPDVASLRTLVVEVVPVIDLPDPGQAEGGVVAPSDMIVNNLFPGLHVAGPGRAPAWLDPEQISVALYREGEEIAAGAVAGPWETLLWLVNQTVAQGWVIEPEHLLLTGSLAMPVPLQGGLHVADFGELGRLELWVE